LLVLVLLLCDLTSAVVFALLWYAVY